MCGDGAPPRQNGPEGRRHTTTEMRIFIGIDLDPEVRTRIERFLEGVEGFAPEARWVRPESLHITLKFVGEQMAERVQAITEHLQLVESSAFEIRAGGYGF